eukprot:12469493-Alexandrium_andersonii.AAC.1
MATRIFAGDGTVEAFQNYSTSGAGSLRGVSASAGRKLLLKAARRGALETQRWESALEAERSRVRGKVPSKGHRC